MTQIFNEASQFKDENGTPYGVKHVDGKPRVSAMPYTYDIAEGNITNHTSWSKIGFNGAIAADGSEEDMWPTSTAYTWPSSVGKWFVSSSSNTDNGATGQLKVVTLNAGGAGYSPSDILTVVQAGGALGSVRVLTLGGGGAVATFEILTCGSGYTVANGLATTVSPAGGTNCLLNITGVSAVASTGAWVIDIYYLDGSFGEKSVRRTLNGDTPVWIADDCYRLQNARLRETGTGLLPVGLISIKEGATTYGAISIGRTRMRQCIWTVPYGKVLYVTQIAFSCSDQAASKYTRFTTKANYDNLSNYVLQRGLFMPYNEVTLNNTAYFRELNPPTKLPATVDLKVSVSANSAAQGTCSLRGWTETA